jgi:hypothetical protein
MFHKQKKKKKKTAKKKIKQKKSRQFFEALCSKPRMLKFTQKK